MFSFAKNLRISQKIGVCYFVLLVTFASVAIYNVRSLEQVADGTEEIYQNYFTSAINLAGAEAALSHLFIAQKSHIIAPDDRAMRQQEDIIQHSITQFNERMSQFEQTLDPGLETETFLDLMQKAERLLAMNDEIVSLSQTNNDVKAADLSAGAFATLYHEIVEMNETMLQTNVDGAAHFYEKAQSSFQLTERIVIVVAVVFCVFGLMMFGVLARSISAPLGNLRGVLNQMARGEGQIDETLLNRRDEIGMLGQSVMDLKVAIEEKSTAEAAFKAREAREVSHVVEALRTNIDKLAKGDLTVFIDEAFADKYETLRADFNNLTERLSHTVSALQDNAASIRNGASEISQSSGALAQRTESQAATLEETSAAMDELNASVAAGADATRSVATTMGEASDQAEASSEIVENAVGAMSQIEQSSSQIAQIVGVIDDIAFQTNLLALNAGVEAARAGDAGRGFAVVASEVRALAQRSSESAMEIKSLISESEQQVEKGVKLVGSAGTAINGIAERVNQISVLVSELSVRAAEQSENLAEINSGTSQLEQVTQRNAAMAEEATATSQVLDGDAQSLTETLEFFHVGRGGYLSETAQDEAA
ncbi:methyl-accepting chemotaxis protein [Shimia sp. MMG029]|uniref:methyl-accepting chemotaxis protein n=1 Tax=Shimia sp. MMG029 TaxID=3021978 RepID=UPI0022FE95B3|nr:HAMP domain-containing methyl-accepting chemotaxis protein [Shimia sp. MMG029]MDA5557780.1 HAMP domain-containing methyl-accepting chemotaxis protein [Shimia sp. MMG029]